MCLVRASNSDPVKIKKLSLAEVTKHALIFGERGYGDRKTEITLKFPLGHQQWHN